MDFVTALGFTAATLTTAAFVPQLLKTWRSKSAGDVSFAMLATFSCGVLLWLIYGIYLNALPIVLANSITLLLNLTIIWLKFRYDHV
jgi:MtN3 and saliva related transmembrane protein